MVVYPVPGSLHYVALEVIEVSSKLNFPFLEAPYNTDFSVSKCHVW